MPATLPCYTPADGPLHAGAPAHSVSRWSSLSARSITSSALVAPQPAPAAIALSPVARRLNLLLWTLTLRSQWTRVKREQYARGEHCRAAGRARRGGGARLDPGCPRSGTPRHEKTFGKFLPTRRRAARRGNYRAFLRPPLPLIARAGASPHIRGTPEHFRPLDPGSVATRGPRPPRRSAPLLPPQLLLLLRSGARLASSVGRARPLRPLLFNAGPNTRFPRPRRKIASVRSYLSVAWKNPWKKFARVLSYLSVA